MISRERYGSTMTAMALALPLSGGRRLTDPMLEVYWRVLADVADDEFERAAMSIMRNGGRAPFFPTPAELLAAATPAGQAEAMLVLERVRRLAEYCPRTGDTWRVSTLRAQLGEGAVLGFVAIGGDAGMRELQDPAHAPFARQRFAAAYLDGVGRDERSALPTPPAQIPGAVRRLTARIGNPPGVRLVADDEGEGAA